jgi:hypothetical protein
MAEFEAKPASAPFDSGKSNAAPGRPQAARMNSRYAPNPLDTWANRHPEADRRPAPKWQVEQRNHRIYISSRFSLEVE